MMEDTFESSVEDLPIETLPVLTDKDFARMRAPQIAMRAYINPQSSERVRDAAARYLLNY